MTSILTRGVALFGLGVSIAEAMDAHLFEALVLAVVSYLLLKRSGSYE